ncbi:uncharacterized protein [Eurosta solidaginis]|uniref:uncharacterized protein n=1 Tax=Eurosta solidaginis TaxID=178769 RepID=UPI003530D8E0
MCFLKIFGETEQMIKTVNKYKVQLECGGLIKGDRCGKHTPSHKLSIEKHNEVLEHISSIPKYQSHYSRRHTNMLYFQSDLNISKLYNLYAEKFDDPVSKSKYCEIFRSLNIKFKKPQLDLCNTCEKFILQIQNSLDAEEKSSLKSLQKEHHDQADIAYCCKKADKQLSVANKTVMMFSMDLQQCLPTPHINASMFFYKRPLWTYNFTMHEGSTNKAQCFIWNETIAKRGSNDIGSCIFKCLSTVPPMVKHIILYSDSCPGQNRNANICAMFQMVLKSTTIETIDHKFLVVGHTHMECDTVHAQIEKRKKNSSGSIQHPHDWANLIAAANKKYIVHELKQNEFFDFSDLLKNNFNWKTTNSSGTHILYFIKV